jgi:hypothetical protein
VRKSLYITLTAIVVLLLSAASYALAGTAKPTRSSTTTRTVTVASVATIHGCVNKKTHAIYDESRCPKGYSAVTWPTKAGSGAAGAPGAAGKNGSNGVNGTNGTNGANGAAATISVGSVSTGAAGSNASVSNVGTTSAAKLNFSIPQGATGPAGAAGTTGSTGAAGVAGTAPWGTPVALSPTSGTSVHACPYVASTSTATGTPATTITWEGGTYIYIASACQSVGGGSGGFGGTPDVSPSNWSEVAAAGLNGSADAWAFIDPGVCAAGGSCTTPVISHGGVAGSGVSFGYNDIGQYELTITGCPAADTPAAGQPFPAAITVTPEGAYPGESSHDSSVIQVSGSVRDTTSLGVLGGLGIVHAFMYLGTPDQTTIGQTDSVDEPFAVLLNC